jgi:ubiquinone/menaquinone biosynthesis C-methylase UbiE
MYHVKTKDPTLFGHDLSRVVIGKQSLNIVNKMPIGIVSILPLWFPLRAMYSHIKQYQFVTKHLQNQKVLDVACGVGYGSEILRRQGNVVTGVDINPANISYARKNYLENKYLVGNAEDLSNFANSTFNAVVSIQTIEHLWHPKKAMAEFHRVLKTNGLLIGAIPINHKHEMPPDAEAPNVYSFEDCRKLLSPNFRNVEWFLHCFKDHSFMSVKESFFENIGAIRGDFVFICRNP